MAKEAKEREVLHQQSVEVVKQWSNTIAVRGLFIRNYQQIKHASQAKAVTFIIKKGQRQKKLEAKKIRDEMEEEKRKQIDREEAEFQAQKRKEALQKAKSQLYYQSDCVRGLHVGVASQCHSPATCSGS